VISDILMPNMDGYEFVERMRANPATAQMPMIFYTATYREREANRDGAVLRRALGAAQTVRPGRDHAHRARSAGPGAGSGVAPPILAAQGEQRMFGSTSTVAEYLDEVESSSQTLTRMANNGDMARARSLEQIDTMTRALQFAVEPAGGEPAPDRADRTGHRTGRRARSGKS
jgi:hypothetical protein